MWQVDVADAVTEEERSHVPPFNASAVYWDDIVRSEHGCRLHSYRTDDDEPPELRQQLISRPYQTNTFRIQV